MKRRKKRDVKAAAEAAEKRSKGEPVEPAEEPTGPLNPPETAKHPGGRPTDYRLKYCELAHELCSQGATDVEVADAIGISHATLYRWIAKHKEFRESMRLGKDAADDRVERTMYHRAVGYSYDTVKVFQFEGSPVVVPVREHVPPDIGAAKHWLHNRRAKDWQDKQTITHSADGAFLAMLRHISGEGE